MTNDTITPTGPWHDWFEFVAAAILGLATLGSAWTAYQSSLWGGIQSFRIAEAQIQGRKGAEKAVYANQLRGIDVMLFERYIGALSENNRQLADFLLQRFRPEFKPAVEAWLATKPLKNPDAPRTPFVMKEYSIALDREARQLAQMEEAKFAEARKANEISDRYLLIAVFFSVVLFLAGITAAFEQRKLQIALLGLSMFTMAAAAVALLFMPLAVE